jgi:hypothetical protein
VPTPFGPPVVGDGFGRMARSIAVIGRLTTRSLRKITLRCQLVPEGVELFSYPTNVVNEQLRVRSYSSSAARCTSCHTASSDAEHSVGLFRQRGIRVFRVDGPRFIMVSCVKALDANVRSWELLPVVPGW